MKKITVFIFLLFFNLQLFAQIEEHFTLAYTGNKELVFLMEDKDGNIEISIQSTESNKIAYFILSSTNDIIKFNEALKSLKTKWNEYKEIAQKNNVEQFQKQVDIEFPRMTLAWYWSEWYSGPRSKPEIFFFISNGYYIMNIHKESSSRTNSYISEKADIILITEKDFDTLISLTEIKTIQEKLKTNVADLFN